MVESLELEIPTWDKIYDFLLSLAEKIREDVFKPGVIVGVSRGGWPPARVMSDLLENPEIANVKAQFYIGVAKTKGEPVITQPVSVSVDDKEVLLVDDVADTGKSLRLVKSHLMRKGATEVKIATIYYKPWSVIIPDYYEKKTSSWVIFPWERKEAVRNIIKRYQNEGKTVEEAKDKLLRSGFDSELAERFILEIVEGET
ncbi:MAG: phosphoribosyltransferase [Candidatus Bathyarchaeota archaeon]|nr:MAG: phosphoribosyltransferase [Candidatus Bathyarchaeota archaeon]